MKSIIAAFLLVAFSASAYAATNGSGARLHTITTSRASVGASQSPSGATIIIAIGDTFHKESTNGSGAVLRSDLTPRSMPVEATPATAWFLY